jgi:hypothetical protein
LREETRHSLLEDCIMAKPTMPLSFRVDPDVYAAVQEVAKQSDRTMSAVLNELLASSLKAARRASARVTSELTPQTTA